jgi:hypothetical protein
VLDTGDFFSIIELEKALKNDNNARPFKEAGLQDVHLPKLLLHGKAENLIF